MSIFYSEAPKYWAAGLQAIPLRVAAKVPIPKAWQTFSGELVSDDLKVDWLHRLANSNIGVVAGAASGVIFLDNDTVDARVAAMMDGLLPPSPWTRIGAKGFVRAYRYDGANSASWQILDENGKVVVELLSSLRQAVMPPSIHPDTGLPYKATGDLFDPEVMAGLVCLPSGLEGMLIAALGELGIKAKPKTRVRVSAPVVLGGRDVAMVRVAGHFADCVVKGEVSFCDVRDQMLGWYESRVEKVAGDELDIDKGVAKIAEFLVRDVVDKGKSLPDGWDAGLSDEEREVYGFLVFGADHKKWTYQQITDWVTSEMMVHDPNSDGARKCLDGVMERIVRSDCDEVSIDQLLNYARMVTGFKNVRITVLRSSVKAKQRSGIKGDSHLEIGNAFIAELRAITDHKYWGGEFYSWEGSHWVVIPRYELVARVGQEFGELAAAKRQSEHASIVKFMADAMRVDSLNVSGTDGINFKNGYLMGVVGKGVVLMPHDQMYGCTYVLGYDYNPSASGKFPKFAKFLEDSWSADVDYIDKVRALRQAMALTLMGKGPAFQRAVLLHGVANTGKSVMLKIVGKLLPTSAQSAIPPEKWQERFDTSGLVGKLLNVCGELDEKKPLNGKAFKQIVCGETTHMEKKNQDGFDYEPRAFHWFASNHLPKSTDASEGFSRRWVLLNFSKIVRKEVMVLDLADIIVREEGEAIIAWVAELAGEMAKGNYQMSWTLPSSHHMLMRDMQSQNNSVLQFMQDSGLVLMANAILKAPAPILEDTLYDAYFGYVSVAGGAPAVRLPTFRQRMRELGSAMGFELNEVTTSSGARSFEYTNLILARNGGVKMPK